MDLVETHREANSDHALAAAIREATARRPSQTDSWFEPGYLFRVQALQRVFLTTLTRHRLTNLSGRKILEVGCGYGHWLRSFGDWGAEPGDLHGIDLLEDRVAEARRRCLPAVDVRCGNAARLEFADASFDLVLMSLVLSIMPDYALRSRVAAEVSRVLKPGGVVLWYDFRYPPMRGRDRMIAMTRRRIAEAFPGFELKLRSASAIPPVTRRLARYAWALCCWLDTVRFLNTHYVGVLVKPTQPLS
jgi:SAM-dependent methyltransferase